jgi:acetate---CoA ligase (ADP-forming)
LSREKDPPSFPDLGRLVDPSSVVLIGASDTPGSIGSRLATNVIDHSSLRGQVYVVNPRHAQVHGLLTYKSVLDLPHTPDVAVIALSAAQAPDVVRDCGRKGIPFAAVLSSGFSEAGPEGQLLQDQLVVAARETGIRIYGPNCPGISNITQRIGLNFSPAFADDLTAGVIGVATQGGGLGRTLLQAMERGIGVAQWLSSGNEADLDISDFIYHLAQSDDVKVIATIIEGIRDGERFIRAALHARRLDKPIIAIKLGRSEYGARAAMSHTTSMTGEAEVNRAALAQLGVVQVDDLDELIDTSALFAQALPGADEAVAVYTYSGGTAALTADMVGAAGLRLAELGAPTTQALADALTRFGTHANPVDTGTEVLARPDLIRATLAPVLRDPAVGITLVPIPIEMGATTAELARAIAELRQQTGAVILPVWMTDRLGEGYRILADAGVVPARSISKSISAVAKWVWAGAERSADPDWTPPARVPAVHGDPVAVTEAAAKARLRAAGVEVPEGRLATSPAEAGQAAAELGFPVAMKIVSVDVLHKTDAGGVRLGVADKAGAIRAYNSIVRAVEADHPGARLDGVLVERMLPPEGYEAIVGVHYDATFGPLITFGTGGVLVEVIRDAARQLLPLNAAAAARLIERTTLGTVLKGQRGRPPADLSLLAATLVRLSNYVLGHAGTVCELEINPLWISASGDRVVALDSLIVVRTPSPTGELVEVSQR